MSPWKQSSTRTTRRRWPLRPKLDNARAVAQARAWHEAIPAFPAPRFVREDENAGRADHAVVLMIVDSTTVEGV